ncbi:DUF1269 domain-containing protein (plasmid) [Acaryochloris sp. 'Moss Beach']|uniref:general stress protein n=1 Tax=Acaryochloris sp. 'Moss Beach' TaxID=2740837 RepID=UPI001F43E08E|nr:general stress protein [Acaryochloris sp. 'Moss Beach']UJB72814.1 DUF1269 domain-containing protein [Acaryochloris sp. 'Moss Beach']
MSTIKYDLTPPEYKQALGVFARGVDAESAVVNLKANDFPIEKLSMIAKDNSLSHEIKGVEVKEQAGQVTVDTAATGAVTGGALGAIAGLLVSLGTLTIPGIGPILMAGATASTLVTTFAGGAVGATTGVLVGALASLGIPEERAIIYNNYVAKGYYLLIVEGTISEIKSAEKILNQSGIQRWEIFYARNQKVTALKNILPNA